MRSALFIFTAALSACASTPTTRTERAVRDALDGARTAHHFPGAVAAWTGPDGATYAVASGSADPEARVPMTPRSRMLAASIGKTFVAAAALALHREGALDLDAPLSAVLGSRAWFDRLPNHDDLTIRHLLTHSGGVPDHVYTPAFTELFTEARGGETVPPEALISLVLDTEPLFPAGEGWSYSDTGYLLVGLAIEAVTGVPWTRVVDERFLEPLGLEATTPSDHRALAGLAVGHTAVDNPFGLPTRLSDTRGRLRWDPAIEGTGGGFVSTAADLSRWGHVLWSGGAMQGPYLDALLEGVPCGPDAPGISYGLGVSIEAEGAHGPVLGHRGWIPGYVSSLRHHPDHHTTIAIQVNTDVGMLGPNGALAALERAVTRAVLGPP